MTSSGRVYHSCPVGGKALVADKLTDKLYHRFEFDKDGNPIGFNHGGVTVRLE